MKSNPTEPILSIYFIYMSIVTLKRKTAAKYNNVSVNVPQFSTVGGYRNQGWVGQTSLSRSLPRSLRRGDTLRGYGGCCGTYNIANPVNNPDLCSRNNNQVIKHASMNTSGMIMTKYRWIRRGRPFTSVKPGAGNILYRSGSELTDRRKKNTLCDQNECDKNNTAVPPVCDSCNVVPTMFRNYANTPQSFSEPYPNPITKSIQDMKLPISQGEYMTQETQCCVRLDETFLDQENQAPYCRTAFTCG